MLHHKLLMLDERRGDGLLANAFEVASGAVKAVSWFKNQIEEMRRRVIEIERVYHSKEIPDCLREQVYLDRPAA
jgi:hypothetical protein